VVQPPNCDGCTHPSGWNTLMTATFCRLRVMGGPIHHQHQSYDTDFKWQLTKFNGSWWYLNALRAYFIMKWCDDASLHHMLWWCDTHIMQCDCNKMSFEGGPPPKKMDKLQHIVVWGRSPTLKDILKQVVTTLFW